MISPPRWRPRNQSVCRPTQGYVECPDESVYVICIALFSLSYKPNSFKASDTFCGCQSAMWINVSKRRQPEGENVYATDFNTPRRKIRCIDDNAGAISQNFAVNQYATRQNQNIPTPNSLLLERPSMQKLEVNHIWQE